MIKPTIILISEDNEHNNIIKSTFSNDYNILVFEDSFDAMPYIKTIDLNLITPIIIMDVNANALGYYKLGEQLFNSPNTKLIPLIGLVEDLNCVQPMFFNTMDYIRKPVDITMLSVTLSNMLDLYTLKKTITSLSIKRLENMNRHSEFIYTLLENSEFRGHNYCKGHINRCVDYAKILLKQLINDESYPEVIESSLIDEISIIIPYHDLGNTEISEDIFFKTSPLTEKEFEELQNHVEHGLRIVEENASVDPVLHHYKNSIKELIEFHHERFDGSGYPKGVKGDKIPLSAQIMGIIDVYEGLTTERSYKTRVLHEEAIQYIQENSNILFDKRLCDAFVSCNKEIKSILSEYTISTRKQA